LTQLRVQNRLNSVRLKNGGGRLCVVHFAETTRKLCHEDCFIYECIYTLPAYQFRQFIQPKQTSINLGYPILSTDLYGKTVT